MRFWEPKNIIGRIRSWYCARKNLKKIKAKMGKGGYIAVGKKGKEFADKLEAEVQKKEAEKR